MSRSRTAAAAASLAALILFAPAEALGQDLSDGQTWLQIWAVPRLSENWRLHNELQPRWTDGSSELGLTIVRNAVGRMVHPRASAWVGHAWILRTAGEGVRHEQRIWQQLTLTSPASWRWVSTARLRLEQRWLDDWDDNAHRFRTQLRTQHSLGGTRWSVATYDEFMFNLDDTGNGPLRGYDRNRLYAGLLRQLSPALSIEGGYLWENATVDTSTTRNDHVALFTVNILTRNLR